jgi:hypothetical protein
VFVVLAGEQEEEDRLSSILTSHLSIAATTTHNLIPQFQSSTAISNINFQCATTISMVSSC